MEITLKKIFLIICPTKATKDDIDKLKISDKKKKKLLFYMIQ